MSEPRKLSVWLDDNEAPIGLLTDNAERAPVFAYDRAYLGQGRSALPLSLRLPLQEECFDPRATRAFFGNLLHESNYMRQKLDREGIDPDDLIEVLAAVGKDCPGSVSCTLPGEPRPKRPGHLKSDYREIVNLDAIVTELASRREPPVQDGNDSDPSPIAGVQPKIAATVRDGVFLFPELGAPTTHILKVSPNEDSQQSLIEHACLNFARRFGCETIEHELLLIAGKHTLLVKRYDRRVDGDFVYRTHQEDMAQALGLESRQKYQRYGTKGTRTRYDASNIIDLLRKTRRARADLEAFFRLTLVNLILGNTDNHAKNHSLLFDDGPVPRFAPAYDLVSTVANASHRKDFSFDIGRARTFSALTPGDLISFAELIALSPGRAQRLYRNEKERWKKIGLAQQAAQSVEDLPRPMAETLISIWGARWTVLETLFTAI